MRQLLTVALVALLASSSIAAEVTDLYAVRFDVGGRLVALEGEGGRVRHIGEKEAIVEVVRGNEPPGLAGVEPTLLPTVGRGERLFVCYPRSGSQILSTHGRVLWADSAGAFVMAVGRESIDALRAASFHLHELPHSIDAAAWFDTTPAPLIREKTRTGELRVRGVVEDVLSAVSNDSLMAHVERLSTYPDGSLRSRYVARDECLTEAKPYIMNRLRAYLPAGASVDTQRFHMSSYSCDDDTLVVEYPADNIIGTLPGTGRLSGYYIIGAHYDAIAGGSFPGEPMWWCDNPAPGADDNGTGVAVVLEAARVLSDVSFPFDVRFILWTGEELGLHGSDAHADSAAAEGDTIYGVLNVDMVGYQPNASAPDTCHIVTNTGTRWFADWITGTAGLYPSHFDDWHIQRIDEALAYSDHASYWFKGYDALIAIEHWNPRDRNPMYHTVTDTAGAVLASQLGGVGRVVAGSMARLSETDGTFNLAVSPEDLSLSPSSPDLGDIVIMSVKAHAFGPDEDADLTLEVWDGAPGEGELLTRYEESRVMGGGEVIYHDFAWLPEDDDLGSHELTIVVDAGGVAELSDADNTAVKEIRVNDPNDLFVMEHFTYPNPAGDGDDLSFRYELSREAAAADIRVFDITGQELGLFQKGLEAGGPGEGLGTSAGWNTVGWDGFDGPADDLASGVYVYKLRVYSRGITEAADEVTGRFAVVR